VEGKQRQRNISKGITGATELVKKTKKNKPKKKKRKARRGKGGKKRRSVVFFSLDRKPRAC
jgi:hypothetical protein